MSLLPEDRDLFEKKNTAAQHKHCKSLSLEQQGQIKSTDAAAHKRKYELLPRERKLRRMEIRTEQHHEHLTEKEKKISAQIRSVAATLYEKIYLDKPTVEFLREHFYKDPTLALTYFYCCATDPHVVIFNDELQPDVDTSVVWNHISNLIGSPIGQEEAMLLPRDIQQP